MYRTSREFRMHSENVAAVKKGLVQIERAHKQAIRDNDSAALATFRRLHLLAIGILAEATLRKITTDPNGFNDRERQFIWRAASQVDRWQTAVDLAFRRHYAVLIHEPFDSTTVDEGTFQRYSQVLALLDEDLRPVIEDRNKTAHGQWTWQLKSRKENEFKQDRAPDPPNYVVVHSQSKLISVISELVYVLAVSESTFDRDYELAMNRLDEARSNLDGAGYGDFVQDLRRTRVARISE